MKEHHGLELRHLKPIKILGEKCETAIFRHWKTSRIKAKEQSLLITPSYFMKFPGHNIRKADPNRVYCSARVQRQHLEFWKPKEARIHRAHIREKTAAQIEKERQRQRPIDV